METTVSSKGQVVLPAEVREQLGITEGTKMLIKIKKGEVIMKPIENILNLRGILSEEKKTAAELLRDVRRKWEQKLKRLGV